MALRALPNSAQRWRGPPSVIGGHSRLSAGWLVYRRLHVLLKREGCLINHKKLFRLYREETFAVRRGGCRKRAIGNQGTDDGADNTERPPVAQFRIGSTHARPPFPTIASPSIPLRKSTGLVATITRTVPDGPITGLPSAHGRCPQSSPHPRRGQPGW